MVLRQVLDEIYTTTRNEMTIKTMTLEKAINEVLKAGPTINSIVELCEMAVQAERTSAEMRLALARVRGRVSAVVEEGASG